MSHDQDHARNLGRWLSDARTVDSDELFRTYLTRLMKILKIVATCDNHVNVLQHIQGYLKTRLVAADKRELVETIEQYRTGLLPLVVPIALLRHHFRWQPDAITHSHTI